MNSNWKYVSFESIFKWSNKSNIGSRQGKEKGKYKLFISSRDMFKYYDEYLEEGESLVFGTGGNPSIHYVNDKFAYTNHTETAKKRINDINTKFYYFYFQMNNFQQLQSTFVGGGIKNSSKKKIGKLIVPEPSFEEQNRIVAKIEELFSNLDNSIAELTTAKEKLKIYRRAVLKEAFSNIESKKTIREISEIVTSGSRGWAKYYSDNGSAFIRIGNLTRTGINIDFSDVQHLSLPQNVEGRRTKLSPNDILVSITADLGSIGLVPNDVGDAYVNQHIAMIRLSNPYQAKFIALYLRSMDGQKEMLKNKRGAGKLGLGLDDIRDTHVPFVSNELADSILSNIDSRLSVCDSIEKSVDQSLQQAEALRQSILKNAFEGKL